MLFFCLQVCGMLTPSHGIKERAVERFITIDARHNKNTNEYAQISAPILSAELFPSALQMEFCARF